ncbi:Rhomboid protease GlpG [Thalassocella blandensis]|nr:Rhomboid protease GlpG [Thalassocella blandensis]
MSWIVFAEFPLAEDLSQINKALNHHNIPHRFTEEQGRQRLWLPGQHFVEPVKEIIHAVKAQGYRVPESVEESGHSTVSMSSVSFLPILLTRPITLLLIIMGVLGYLVIFFSLAKMHYWLALKPDLMEQGQLWRLITPIFLHYSLMHVVFNCLWIWELGKRLELVMGSLALLGLSLVTAVVSNFAQYWIAGSVEIGGLSGVVYAFFGCAFVLQYFRPSAGLNMPKGFYAVIFGFLLAGFTGIFEVIFGINMANWCHLFGLISGLVCALVLVLLQKHKE